MVANKDITGIFHFLIFAPWQPAQNMLLQYCAIPPFLHSDGTWLAYVSG